MARYELGEEIVLEWYTTDEAGNAQSCDTTPTVTVTGPGVADGAVTTTNPSTGRYVSTYEPTQAGRHTFEFAGEVDASPVYDTQTKVVHDALAEGQGTSFPDGIASWVSAVV